MTRDRRGSWEEERPPTRLGESLDGVAHRLGMAPTRALGAVFGAWPEVVGPQIAAHATPVRLRDGVLVVQVDEPAWATQLRYLEADLLGRIAAVAGGGVVTRLEVRVGAGRERRNGPSGW